MTDRQGKIRPIRQLQKIRSMVDVSTCLKRDLSKARMDNDVLLSDKKRLNRKVETFHGFIQIALCTKLFFCLYHQHTCLKCCPSFSHAICRLKYKK